MDYEKAYDAYYYAHDCGIPYERNDHWLNFFGWIAERIVQDIHPGSLLDAGCAMGFLVEGLRQRGVEAWGVDVSEYAIAQVHDSIKPFCKTGSITEPFDRNYDLISCIEVLEHIPASEAEIALQNICQHTDDVLFSSTPFDYKEVTHVNVHPPEYWAGMFARQGLFRDHEFDASFLTPWAVRFRRSSYEKVVFVQAYERRFFQLWKENVDLRAHTHQQKDDLNYFDQKVQEKESELSQLKSQLDEIQRSRAWRFMSWLQRIRLFFVPKGSKADRAIFKQGR